MMGGRGVMLVAAFVDAAAVVDVAAVDVDDDSIAGYPDGKHHHFFAYIASQ